MIYELYLEPRTGKWRIRITVIYLFFFSWSRVLHTSAVRGDAPHTAVPHEFSSYDEAAKHAQDTGLPKAYMLRQRSKGYTTWLQGEGCHGTS